MRKLNVNRKLPEKTLAEKILMKEAFRKLMEELPLEEQIRLCEVLRDKGLDLLVDQMQTENQKPRK